MVPATISRLILGTIPTAVIAPFGVKDRLLQYERRRRLHAGNSPHAPGHVVRIGQAATAAEDQQMRIGRDDLVADAVLETRHHGQHQDERGHAEKYPADPDPDE